MRRAIKRAFIVGTLAIAVGGCGISANKQKAESAASRFHRDFNGGKFAEIVSGATPAFRAAGTQADTIAFLQAVHTKLGGFKSAEPGQWRVNSTPGGTFVDLSYSSQFELGSGVESFTFLISGEQASLQAYNINSRELVLK